MARHTTESTATQFHPPGLPSQLPSVEQLASAPDGVGKVQSAAAAIAHHAAWVDLYHERCSHGRASAAHFISVSQPYSGAFLQAVPSAPDLRMASDAFEVVVQRRLRAPLAALGGDRYSLHTQRISVALHLAAAEEILDTVMLDRAAAAARATA